MRRMIVLLTTVLLLGSASVAAAECAWVLWERTRQVRAPRFDVFRDWIISGAFQTQTAYEEALKMTWEITKDPDPPSDPSITQEVFTPHGVHGHIQIIRKTKQGDPPDSIRYSYQCLPDTLDPREKKG